jgi:hypothetical protein
MILSEKFNELMRLASRVLSVVKLPKVDVNPDEVFYCDIVSLTKAIAVLTDRAFSGYMKRALSLGYSEGDTRAAFFLVAERKIRRRIDKVLDKIGSEEEWR